MSKPSKALAAKLVEARKKIVPLTAEEIYNRGGLEYYHDNGDPGSDGRCAVWRSNGMLQTWKTRPGDFRHPVKYGLRHYSAITPTNIGVHDPETCPVSSVFDTHYGFGGN